MSPAWSDAASAVWGKTGDEGTWLPLVVHLEDTVDVARLIWSEWLPEAVTERVTRALTGPDAPGSALFAWLAAVHDIAKASPAFAGKANRPGYEHIGDRLVRVGLVCPNVPRDDYAHHSVMGQIVIEEWLRSVGLNHEQARSLGVIVGGHHGTPPTSASVMDVKRKRTRRRRRDLAFGDEAWENVRSEILAWAATLVDFPAIARALPPGGIPVTAQVDLSAALIVADWLASDEHRFGYDDLTDLETRRHAALRSIAFPSPWTPDQVTADTLPAFFTARFPRLAGHQMRPLQVELARMCLDVPEAPLLVVEAPMGEGKTEAAFIAAEILASRFGCGGTFIALPTMATTDAMFGRVLDWLRHQPGDETSVFLAHSKAALNSDYESLTRAGLARYHGVYDEDDITSGRLAPVVDTWLRGRKRGVLADHVIGTIDQVLFGALQSKHLALRHLALSGKVVIVDEVHAADDYMRTFLTVVLEWLGAYGTPVVLLSATLPRAQRTELVEAYVRGRSGESRPTLPPFDGAAYPAITMATRTLTTQAIPPSARTADVEVVPLADGGVTALLRRELASGGCAAVIRNTVGRAQETYQELRRLFGSDVVLVHSRFIAPDRLRLETALRERLGPPSGAAERPHRLIVVGTQVLEQSLDIDIDIMVSDIAPLDLLLQRMGRLHRHDRPRDSRPPALRRARFHVDGITAKVDGAPTFEPGSQAVYGEYRLLRAVAALPALARGASAAVTLPTDIPTLVSAAYDEDAAPPPGWSERWDAAHRAYEEDRGRQRQAARSFLLRAPGERLDLVGWLESPVSSESDDLERVGRAQVRDTEDSLEVVLAYRGDDGLLHVMPGAQAHAGAPIPMTITRHDEAVARSAATCTVRLPRALTHPGVLDTVIAQLEAVPDVGGWQQSHWLRGRLVLPLDGGLRATLCDHLIHYDRRLGLIVEPLAPHKEDA